MRSSELVGPNSPGDPLHAMWLATGRMMHHFTEAEGVAFAYLCELSNSKDAKAIFAGDARIDNIKSHVERLFKSRCQELPPKTANNFGQLKVISRLRNDIAHKGLLIGNNTSEYYIDDSNWSLDKPIRYVVTLELVDFAAQDLIAIKKFFGSLVRDLSIPSLREIPSLMSFFDQADKPYTWQYKSPQPIRTPSKLPTRPA